MLHIAAGVFLGLIAYSITMGWWAGRASRREKRRIAREARRWEREMQQREARRLSELHAEQQRIERQRLDEIRRQTPPVKLIEDKGLFLMWLGSVAALIVFVWVVHLMHLRYG